MNARILSILLVFFVAIPTASAITLDKETEDQIFSVLERANRSPDAVTRALATEAFGSLRPKETTQAALDALKDPVFEVRAAAMRALIVMKNKAYEPVLFNDMANPRRDMEAEIMPMLDALGDKEMLALSNKLIADERAATKNALISAIGKRGGSRMLAFFKPLMKHKDQALADGVTGYVLTLKTKEALPLYQEILKSGNADQQKRALESLTGFPKGTHMKMVQKLLKSSDQETRWRAAEVLAHHGDRSGVKVLLPALTNGTTPQIIRALDALIQIPGKEILPDLAFFLKRKATPPEIIKRSLEIHFRLKDMGVVKTLRKLRQRDNIHVQAAAIYYLGLIEQGRALPDLHEALFHGNPVVRKAATQAVERIASRESIPILKRVLDNVREREMRIAVTRALAQIKDQGIVPILSFLVTDPIPEVRSWAMKGLTRVGHKDAVTSLKVAIRGSDIGARSEAVKAIMVLDKAEGLTAFRMSLGWMPAAQIAEISAEMKKDFLPYADIALTSTRPDIRAAGMAVLRNYPKHEDAMLVTALGRSRDNGLKVQVLTRLVEKNGASELERLATYADSTEKVLKVAAVGLLAKTGNPNASPILSKLLFDSEPRVQVTAAIGLLDLSKGGKKRKKKKRKKKRKKKK